MPKYFLISLAAVTAYAVLGTLLDSVLFAEVPPSPDYYPPVGQRFSSKTEGFHQTILKYEDGRAWLELELEPGAAGPPEHVHTSFDEYFWVEEGTLSVMLNGEKRLVRAGESVRVPAGARHKPFNEGAGRVIVRGPMTHQNSIPQEFAVFLKQAYGYFDEAPGNGQVPGALFQMSRFSPRFDTWLADVPVAMQRGLFFLLRPAARALGYQTYYKRFKPADI